MIVLWLLLAVPAVVVVWYVDVRWHPWKPCPRCGGRKRNAGSRPTAYGKYECRHCGGKGEVRRWGAPGERG